MPGCTSPPPGHFARPRSSGSAATTRPARRGDDADAAAAAVGLPCRRRPWTGGGGRPRRTPAVPPSRAETEQGPAHRPDHDARVRADQVGHGLVDDEQAGAMYFTAASLSRGRAESPAAAFRRRSRAHGREREQPRRVAAGRRQARLDRVRLTVLGRQQDGRPKRPDRPIGHHAVAADAGGEIEQQGALADAGVAVEDGQLAQRNPAGPEPFDRLGPDAAHRPHVRLGGGGPSP